MTPDDLAAWAYFAGGIAQVAAGLLFVGLSMNLSEVLPYPALPAPAPRRRSVCSSRPC